MLAGVRIGEGELHVAHTGCTSVHSSSNRTIHEKMSLLEKLGIGLARRPYQSSTTIWQLSSSTVDSSNSPSNHPHYIQSVGANGTE